MSAHVLRKAAALMRERATLAVDSGDGEPWYPAEELHDLIGGGSRNTADSQYIASWPPVVALAIADLLERQAGFIDRFGDFTDIELLGDANALAVARAYLGSDA